MSDILLDVQGHVALVTLNRPEHRNAYTPNLSRDLSKAMVECDQNDQVRSVVVTGAGDYFCVGFDLNTLRNHDEPISASEHVDFRNTYPFQIRKPVICAMNGPAAGFGAAWPLTCDIRIAAEDAAIGFTFVRNGLVPEMGCSWVLPELIGLEKALDLLLSGRKLLGREAQEMGIVLRAVPRDQVLEVAMEKAYDIAHNCAPAVTAMAKRLIWSRRGSSKRLEQMILDDRSHFIWSASQPDLIEGATAFLQNRTPNWTGKVNRDVPHFVTFSDI